MTTTAVIGDPHGCLRELKLLLEELNNVDRIVIAGDLIDRGPDPAAVVRLARERKLEIVKGNHEEKMLRFFQWEVKRGLKKNPIHVWPDREQEWRSLSQEDLDYLNAAPFYLKLNDKWAVVHAGFSCDYTPIEAQDPKKICRMLYVADDNGKYATPDRNHSQPPKSTPWMQRWNQPFNVVYGHAVHSYTVPKVVPAENGYYTYGVDTGCVFGGRLTAIVFDDQKPTVDFIQVPAAKEYHERRKLNSDGESMLVPET